MGSAPQLTPQQRAECREALDENLRRAGSEPPLGYWYLNYAAANMERLGLEEYGGWRLADLKNGLKYIGPNFFSRSLSIVATDSVGYASVGAGRIPSRPFDIELVFSLRSLDASREIRVTMGGLPADSDVGIGQIAMGYDKILWAELRIGIGGKTSSRTPSQSHKWGKVLHAAFQDGGVEAVWTVLDRVWEDIFGRPASFMRRPLSFENIRARCRFMTGQTVRIVKPSSGQLVGVCNGLVLDESGEPVAVELAPQTSPNSAVKVPLAEILDLRPHRYGGEGTAI
ncbi:MAG TPA: hypothetical protein VLI05_01435 [Candidatus Saccharimonadia bacterium]|nr:hypothetical protein [Candidatus Saccharimonadia bacterium]